MRHTRWFAAIAVSLTALGLTAGHATGEPSSAVRITQYAFTPTELTVAVGTTVTWTNDDEETHTVTSASGAFGSAGLGHEEGFKQTFARPGRYEYYCALHPHMKASVVVR